MLLWQAQQAGSARMPRATKRRTTPPLKHDAEWTEHIAPGGKRYYHNRVTKVQHDASASSLWLVNSSKDFKSSSSMSAGACALPHKHGQVDHTRSSGEKGPCHAVCWRSLLLQPLEHITA